MAPWGIDRSRFVWRSCRTKLRPTTSWYVVARYLFSRSYSFAKLIYAWVILEVIQFSRRLARDIRLLLDIAQQGRRVIWQRDARDFATYCVCFFAVLFFMKCYCFLWRRTRKTKNCSGWYASIRNWTWLAPWWVCQTTPQSWLPRLDGLQPLLCSRSVFFFTTAISSWGTPCRPRSEAFLLSYRLLGSFLFTATDSFATSGPWTRS